MKLTVKVTKPFRSEAVPASDEAQGLVTEVGADLGWERSSELRK